MILQTILLTAAVATAVALVTATSPINAVLLLVTTVLLSAGFLVHSSMVFIGLVYVLVYVGAVAMLFVIVVMTMDVRYTTDTGPVYTRHLGLVAMVVAVAASVAGSIGTSTPSYRVFIETAPISDLTSVASGLFGFTAIHFLLLAILILVAIIGPILLCLRPLIDSQSVTEMDST